MKKSGFFFNKNTKFSSQQRKGFLLIFGSEFVSRFCFWGLQAVLVLFLLKNLHFSATEAYAIYGAFTALAFMASILGGLLADKILGSGKCVYIGMLLILIGNILLYLSSIAWFYFGLSFVLLGMGLVTPNNPSLLGNFYTPNDAGRDSGFTLFYIATNMGGILGPVVCGIATQSLGWYSPFAICALILSIWIVFYHFLHFELSKKINAKKVRLFFEREEKPYSKYKIIFFLLAIITFAAIIIRFNYYLSFLLLLAGIGTILGFLKLANSLDKKQRNYSFILLLMIIFCLAFFAYEFQVNNSLLVFYDSYVNKSIFRLHIPASTLAALEPIFVVLFAPILTYLWNALSAKKKAPTTLIKISYGFIFACCGFYIFSLAAKQVLVQQSQINIGWILIGNAMLSIGDLLIMPSVIAAITKWSPDKIKGTMMGFLYLALAFSGYFSGILATLTTLQLSKSDKVYSIIYNYIHIYGFIAYISLLTAIISFTFAYFLRYYMHSNLDENPLNAKVK